MRDPVTVAKRWGVALPTDCNGWSPDDWPDVMDALVRADAAVERLEGLLDSSLAVDENLD